MRQGKPSLPHERNPGGAATDIAPDRELTAEAGGGCSAELVAVTGDDRGLRAEALQNPLRRAGDVGQLLAGI